MNIKFYLTALILLSSVTPTHIHASKNKQMLFVLSCSAAVVGYAAYKYLHSSAYKNMKQSPERQNLPIIDMKDADGLTALHRAIWKGCVPLVKKLLLAGANTEIADKYGYYPLHSALMFNKFEIAELLLEHGANIDAKRGKYQLTALDDAIMSHDLKTVKLLLSWGADPNVCDSNDRTPLHCAADNGYVEIAKELLDHGANVNAMDKYGNTPLHRAAMSSSDYAKEVISILLKYGACVNARNNNDSTSLHLILWFDVKQKIEKIAELIIAGADVNAMSAHGSTILDYALWNNTDEKIIDLLKKNGARSKTNHVKLSNENSNQDSADKSDLNLNVKRSFDHEWDELYLAILLESTEKVRQLLQDGVNINIMNQNGKYPLHQAVKSGNCAIVKLLLEHGANTEIADKDGYYPLHSALMFNKFEIAELLLAHGANIDAKHGKYQLTALDDAIMSHDLKAVKWLLSWGADPNVCDSNDTAPLHCAADDGYVEIAKELLDHGANVNAMNKYGNTPLHEAVRSSSDYAKEVISILLKYGACVNARDSNNFTPLQLILLFNTTQKIEKIEKLIAAGADVNALSKLGSTILDYALWKNADEEIINLLKTNGAIRSTANSLVYDTAKKALISGDISAKPTYLVRFLVDCAEQMEMGLDLLSNFCIDKLVKLFIDYGCDLNELYTFQEYVDVIDPDFPMVYRSEQKISILGIMGIFPVFTQVLIDHGAKVCVNDFSALMSIAAIAQKTIQEEYQEMPEKFFEYDEIALGAGKAFVILFKATTDQDRANFLAQYPKIASFLKLM